MNGARSQSSCLRAAGISPRKELQKEGLSRSIFLSRCLRSLPFISRSAGKERNAAILPNPATVSPCREEAVSIRHRARKLVPRFFPSGIGPAHIYIPDPPNPITRSAHRSGAKIPPGGSSSVTPIVVACERLVKLATRTSAPVPLPREFGKGKQSSCPRACLPQASSA